MLWTYGLRNYLPVIKRLPTTFDNRKTIFWDIRNWVFVLNCQSTSYQFPLDITVDRILHRHSLTSTYDEISNVIQTDFSQSFNDYFNFRIFAKSSFPIN